MDREQSTEQNQKAGQVSSGNCSFWDCAGDLVIGLFGIGFGLALLVTFAVTGVLATSLVAGLGLGLFLAAAIWFFWRSWVLFQTEIHLNQAVFAWSRPRLWLPWMADHEASWTQIKGVKLRFYGSIRQKRKGIGTYVLTLNFDEQPGLYLDQRLSNFQDVLDALARHGLDKFMDKKSLAYLRQHGISAD